MNLNTLNEIHEALQEEYKPELDTDNESIVVDVHGFSTALTIEDKVLTFQCRIMTQGQVVGREAWRDALEIGGDINTVISPYGIGYYGERDDFEGEEEDSPVVLISKVPLGDFTAKELKYQMDSLLKAIMGSRDFVRIAMGDIKIEGDEDEDDDGGDGSTIVTDHVTETATFNTPTNVPH